MTSEEAKKAEKELNALLNMCDPSPLAKELEDALKMAIKALEQQQDVHDTCIEDYPTCTECEHYDSEKHYCPRFCQVIKDTLAEAQPSEDTEVIKVSKRAVKARQGRFVIYDVDWLKENFYTTEEKIYGQPKQPCEDCISREQAIEKAREGLYLDDVITELEWLPSVTPQRPKGKWIEIPVENDIVPVVFKCSECGMRVVNPYKYCPNCGALMEGEDEVGHD